MNKLKTTLNKSLADFTYQDSSMVQILKTTLENVNFQGITVNNKISFCGALLDGTVRQSQISRQKYFQMNVVLFLN